MKSIAAVAALLLASGAAHAQYGRQMSQSQPFTANVGLSLPVREIMAFKDGHAFVIHQGALSVSAEGDVVLNDLPSPVLGTFWPYSADPAVKLLSAVASRPNVASVRPALTLRELLEVNAGAEVFVTEFSGLKYAATLVGIPAVESPASNGNAPSFGSVPSFGNAAGIGNAASIVLLQTGDGLKAVAIDRIQDITFKNPPKLQVSRSEQRNQLRLRLGWGGRRPGATARVGLVYLQRGLRWIPSYKVSLQDKKQAQVKLQATLVNELTDLDNATVHLVIGVPLSAFKDTPDPLGLSDVLGRLSRYFDPNDRTSLPNAGGLGGAVTTQGAFQISPSFGRTPDPEDAELAIESAAKQEDLFVLTLSNVSLRKDERMVLPISEASMPYRDIYTLTLPLLPPSDWIRDNSNLQADVARLMNAPSVVHKIRLTNTSQYPLTTAPALATRDNQMLAQGLLAYAPIGGSSDLEIGTMVDVKVARSERETKRTPEALRYYGDLFSKVDVAGTISLTNFNAGPIELEVTRTVLGEASAEQGGTITRLNVLDDAERTASNGDRTAWSNWPSWWNRINGISRIAWKLRLEPGQTTQLSYTHHYFWR